MPKYKQTILITGAAKRIGAAIALDLAAQGHDLVLHYASSKAEAMRVAALCKKLGVTVTLVQADLTDARACQALWKSLPPVTALIHNASVFKRDTLATMKPAQLRQHLALHVEAPLLLAQGFMKQLPKSATGRIIVIGDGMLGWSVAPQFFSYAVSKHALISTIDILAAAVAPRATANLIAPGATLKGPQDTASSFKTLKSIAPLQRTGNLAEICESVAYLLTAPGVTGQTFNLANGMGLESYRRR
jgi:NAD(P)-dependent dehydrogenase (short-subunit alcohol dehydrogenase family)